MPVHITRSFLFLLMLLLLSGRYTAAREYSYINFTTAQGLAGAVVYSLTQDRDGFMWIGTGTGLSRFDGTSFKNYTIADGLPSNEVLDFFIDQKNRIWLNVFAKALAYYYRGRIYSSSNDPLLKQILISDDQKGYAEDKAGNLLICTAFEVNYIPAGTGWVYTYKLPYDGSKSFFDPVVSHGRIPAQFIVPQRRPLLSRSNATLSFRPLLRIGDKILMPDEDYQKKARITILHPAGRRSFIQPEANLNTFGKFSSDSTVVLNMIHGAYVYSLQQYNCIDTLLYGVAVNISYKDRDGGLWLGTNGQGLFYFPPNLSSSIRPRLGNSKPIQVNHFNTYKDKVWISSNHWHFWELDIAGKTLGRKIPEQEINIRKFLHQPRGNMLRIIPQGIFPDLLKKQKIYRFWNNMKSLSNSGDTIMISTNIWVKRLLFPPRDLDMSFALGGKRLTCTLYEQGRYYLGSLEGMYIRRGNRDTTRPHPVVPGVIVAMCYSYTNNLCWVITSNDGVYCMEGDKVIRHLDVAAGLSSNTCKCIFTDGTKVYVGTVDGLNIIDPSAGFSIRTYYTLDGLLSNDINCVYADSNNVIAGTSEGVSFLDVSRITDTASCNLVLNDITISGRRLDPAVTALSLSPEDDNIEFNYSGISFRSMGRIRYTYRLRGLSDRWEVTDKADLKYPSLPSGAYTLELYATNRFGKRSNLVCFSFVIREYWWEHWWLRLLGSVLLLGTILSVILLRQRSSQKRQQEKLMLKEKIIELEQLALRSQMNPHFIFNSLNSFYQYVIHKDLEGASEFMSSFSKLIRLLFETTTLTRVPLHKEIEFLTTYLKLEKTKLNDSFVFDFSVQERVNPEEIILPTFVLQPFLENSIRHGIQNRQDDKGMIAVRIELVADVLQVSIRDNGVGRAYVEEQKRKFIRIHNSKGLTLTEERIALYNRTHHTEIRFEIRDLYDNDLPSGTLVIVYFPLKDVL